MKNTLLKEYIRKYVRRILNETVASEILKQLGGSKFIAMTGAKNLGDGDKYLSFKLPKSKDGINYVKITLTGNDLYDIEFGKANIKAASYKVVKSLDGIYGDQLQKIFTQYTGLYTKMF